MTEITVRLENADGLHARPAAILAKAAGQYQSKIELKAKGQTKNAKSIMSILSMGLEKGDEVQIIADGSDEALATDSLKALFLSQFADH
jgi:phosphocarrier protein